MRILIVANNDVGLYKFRRELIEKLLSEHEVHISLPYGKYVDNLTEMGCTYHSCEFSRHGMNLVEEAKQFLFYKKILKKIKPDVVLTYTIKPNIYAGMACASLKIPYITNITGLGTAIENGGMLQKILLVLYKFGLRKSQKVFFQNQANCDFMLSHNIIKGDYEIIPGSGVNLTEHKEEAYPESENPLVLVNIGRIMKDKGADEVLYAAKIIKKEYPYVVFKIIGEFDGEYEEKVYNAAKLGEIEFLGKQSDVHTFIKNAHAIVHASYHEGMSNVLLEAAACARPIIATDVPGCRETFVDGVSGITFLPRDREDLVRAIRKFIVLSHEQKNAMGQAGRKKIECEFDRTIVVDKYIKEIEKNK